MQVPSGDPEDEEPDEEALLAREKLAKGPLYMTPDGHGRLKVELEALGTERAKVVQTVSDAAAEGDRSENAEYIYGKRRLRQIDSRMRHLRKIVEAAVLVDPTLDRGERVFFGAQVTLRQGAALTTYQLVGDYETDADKNRISYRSPLGAALLKKEEGDLVTVDTPNGKRTCEIVRVRYG
jgi:transcription elongation factor GreB